MNHPQAWYNRLNSRNGPTTRSPLPPSSACSSSRCIPLPPANLVHAHASQASVGLNESRGEHTHRLGVCLDQLHTHRFRTRSTHGSFTPLLPRTFVLQLQSITLRQLGQIPQANQVLVGSKSPRDEYIYHPRARSNRLHSL